MITKLIDEWSGRLNDSSTNNRQKIVNYYVEAGPDYRGWSKGFNMHFGYYKLGANPFKLEDMLNAMNKEVLDRLQLADYRNNNILDMGCGLGATIRYALSRYPIKNITGITIVPWQIEEAQRMLKEEFQGYKARFELQDYQATTYDDNTFDGAYAIESSCYANGTDKRQFLEETYRILKPGRRLVIADGYMKRNDAMNPLYEYCYRKMCNYWAVPDFGNLNEIKAAMQAIGYKDIQIEEASWNIAPSVMYIPFIAMKYFITKIIPTIFVSKERWQHLMAPLYAMVVGMARKRFGYYIITAEK